MNYNSKAIPQRRFGVIKIDLDPRKLLILLAICEKNIVRYIFLLFSMIPVIGDLSTVILHLLYIILIFKCINKQEIRFGGKEIAILTFIVLSIAMTCLIYPENMVYFFNKDRFWESTFPCLRYFIVGVAFLANEDTMKMVGKASCLGIIVETIFLVLYMMPRGLMGQDDMSRSYQLLPNVMFAINYAFYNKKLPIFVSSGIGVLYLLAMGSRGPIIVILAYILILLVFKSSSKTWVKALVLLFLAFFIFFFLNTKMYTYFLTTVSSVFKGMGLSTRVLDFASSNTVFSYYSGRDNIYAIAIDKIKERPMLGYGLYGEWKWFGWNAHNLYLELMLNFGIPIAVFILIYIITTLVRGVMGNKNTYAKELIIIFSVFVFAKSIFSGTFFDKWLFFIIGFCITEIKKKKRYLHSVDRNPRYTA